MTTAELRVRAADDRRGRRAGRAGVVAAAVAALALPGLLVLGWAVSVMGSRAAWGGLALSVVVAGVSFTAALLVARHSPRNWTAVPLAAAGTALVLTSAYDAYAAVLADYPGRMPRSDVLVVLVQGTWMWLFIPFAWLLLVFPDGRVRNRADRVALVALPVISLVFTLLLAVLPGPLLDPLEDSPRVLGTSPVGYAAYALLPLFLACLARAAWSVRARYQVADARVRVQLRWLVLACASVPGTLLLCWLSYLLIGREDLVVAGLAFMYLAIPLATLMAMLRHDLYDVDKAIVSGAAYGVLAAVLLGVYVGASAVVGQAAGAGSTAAAVAATVLTMLLLLPLRRALLERAGRLLHPRRQRGLAAVDTLLTSVHQGRDRPERIEEVLRGALRDPGLRVGYLLPGTLQVVDHTGRPVPPMGSVPVRLAGEQVGALVAGPGKERPPSDVADASALLVDAVRMRRELAQALGEVEASRARLLRAGYEERRRLERDLHDGAQQRLVSLGMALRLAQRRLRSHREVDVDALIEQSVEDIGGAVSELRQIAHGLRPSSLDDGLEAALANLSRRSALPVTVTYDADGLPDDVSTTAYFVASEAVANAVKHAHAGTVDLVIRREGEAVRVAVTDDGRGGAVVRHGSGLAGLRDRVLALGGRLEVSSPSGRGTTVEAVLPCAS